MTEGERARDALRRIALFASLSEGTLARLAACAVQRVYGPGEIILVEGAPCEAAYFLAEGFVRVYRLSPGGREQVLVRLGPGQALNTVPPFRAQCVNHATVEALSRVVAYAVPTAEFRCITGECPDLALALLRDFAERLHHLTNLVEDLSLRTVRGRLARFLLKQAEAGQVSHRWTQEEMAAYLGTVRDVVGRALRAFADAGLIRLERHRIVLLDREGLEAEAER